MLCKRCGREMKDEDIFCTFCGTRQVEESEMINKEKNANSSSDGTEILIDKKLLTNWMLKIGFLLLVFILYIVSKEEMFDIAGYYQLTVSELVNIANKADFFFNETELETLVFFGKCFSGSVLLYFAASAFVFFEKNGLAAFCIVAGFLGALLAVGGLLYCIMNIAQETEISSIMHMVKETLWIYAGLNAAILGYSIKYI